MATRQVSVGDDPQSGGVKLGAEVLASGGIVVYPTDTLYGLGVDPTRKAAVDRLCRLKQRPVGAGLPLIAANLTQVESCLGVVPPLGRRLCERFWPGPLTLVFTPRRYLVTGVCAVDGSVAVRVPRCAVACRLAELGGQPITATSANLAGEAPATTAMAVASQLALKVDLVLEAEGPLSGAASTIVDVRGVHPVLIRKGAVAWDRVLQSLE